MKKRKKIYFASDLHLGAPYIEDPRKHEIRFVKWLNSIKADAEEIYLLGDIFDFWYEYKYSIPKGFTRFFGKISELTDSGVKIHFFTGNHDVWMFDYLPDECGVIVHQKNLDTNILNKRFFLGHGDEVGNFDKGYKMMKRLFRNRTTQRLFSLIHPDLAIGFAKWWSGKSRIKNERSLKSGYWGDDKEWPVIFAKQYLSRNPGVDYFLFGHRHIAKVIPAGNNTIIYLGDWTNNFSYADFDGEKLNLKFFKE